MFKPSIVSCSTVMQNFTIIVMFNILPMGSNGYAHGHNSVLVVFVDDIT